MIFMTKYSCLRNITERCEGILECFIIHFRRQVAYKYMKMLASVHFSLSTGLCGPVNLHLLNKQKQNQYQ